MVWGATGGGGPSLPRNHVEEHAHIAACRNSTSCRSTDKNVRSGQKCPPQFPCWRTKLSDLQAVLSSGSFVGGRWEKQALDMAWLAIAWRILTIGGPWALSEEIVSDKNQLGSKRIP